MARLLRNIDKIAREKENDVLYVDFNGRNSSKYNYKEDNNRKELLEWLELNKINYEECFGIAFNGFTRYRGGIYIDIICDENSEQFTLVDSHIESKRSMILYIISLSLAMKNSYMDEDDYDYD
ncbi:MAG: hypothetical protein U9P38_07260 [Campylobacterota bacterium]|nr:hypothetical protein [Campylobacterota bacterium]